MNKKVITAICGVILMGGLSVMSCGDPENSDITAPYGNIDPGNPCDCPPCDCNDGGDTDTNSKHHVNPIATINQQGAGGTENNTNHTGGTEGNAGNGGSGGDTHDEWGCNNEPKPKCVKCCAEAKHICYKDCQFFREPGENKNTDYRICLNDCIMDFRNCLKRCK